MPTLSSGVKSLGRSGLDTRTVSLFGVPRFLHISELAIRTETSYFKATGAKHYFK